MKPTAYIVLIIGIVFMISCEQKDQKSESMRKDLNAEEILGNPDYLAISYGGYRRETRDIQPTVDELKEDLKILYAMKIRILRTYNVRLPHASNVLKAIKELKDENPEFEMYVMLGAWIDCKNAWTDLPLNHYEESVYNEAEIERAVELAQLYPDIVKVIAVGNEAMVKWATAYFVQPNIILKWVNHLQHLKQNGDLDENLWVTSSDNFASWGGGGAEYHVPELNELIEAVDFLSIHTYPMHDTHYNPVFWGVSPKETDLSNVQKMDQIMKRSLNYAVSQYDSVMNYMKSLKIDKPVHIGETGWASISSGYYGLNGSKATDEYKQALYYRKMREWTNENNIACFYFEAFDEPWKDAQNPRGSENFFGLFTVDGQAKYALWDLVDQGLFEGLERGGKPITKTYRGNVKNLLLDVVMPPELREVVVNH